MTNKSFQYDNNGNLYHSKINCHKCGKFVGKDGYCDIFEDYYNGGYDVGYPICGKCLLNKNQKNI